MKPPIDFSQLSADQKLDLIADLWDSLEPGDVEVPDWHRRELDARLANGARRPENGLTLEEFLDRLKQSLRP